MGLTMYDVLVFFVNRQGGDEDLTTPKITPPSAEQARPSKSRPKTIAADDDDDDNVVYDGLGDDEDDGGTNSGVR